MYTSTEPGTSVLETKGLSKHFGSLKANDGIDLVIRAGELVKRITELSGAYGLDIDPSALVRDLPMGDRQKVEIVKILAVGAPVLAKHADATAVLEFLGANDHFFLNLSMAVCVTTARNGTAGGAS